MHECSVALLYSTLYDSMDCILPGSSVHGIVQASKLSGLPFLPPRDCPDAGTEPESPVLAGEFFATEYLFRP